MVIGGLVLLRSGHFGLELSDFSLDGVGHDDDSLGCWFVRLLYTTPFGGSSVLVAFQNESGCHFDFQNSILVRVSTG
jgi:hypothetical protein